jgi:hypothetical protein
VLLRHFANARRSGARRGQVSASAFTKSIRH